MLSKKFRRAYKYYYIKLVNSKGTVHSVAMGIAIGFFMSVAIPIGQVIVVVPLAFIFKAHRGMAVFFYFFLQSLHYADFISCGMPYRGENSWHSYYFYPNTVSYRKSHLFF